MPYNNNGEGDFENQCYKFSQSMWTKQNPPCDVPISNRKKGFTLRNGVYISCPQSFEFLPNGQETWQKCLPFPRSSGDMSHCVAISKTEIIYTGGSEKTSRIYKYNPIERKSTEVGKLKHGRWMHSSAFFKGNLIVTGGYNYKTPNIAIGVSTEIIDLKNGISRLGGKLKADRRYHGMGVISKNGKPTLVVFGGACHNKSGHNISRDSIEEWNDETETWKISDLKLDIGRHSFDWCSLEEF